VGLSEDQTLSFTLREESECLLLEVGAESPRFAPALWAVFAFLDDSRLVFLMVVAAIEGYGSTSPTPQRSKP
jgi:hypothetical protein